MRHKLIIDGNAVYEVDDECMACQEAKEKEYFAEEHKPGEHKPGERRPGERKPEERKPGKREESGHKEQTRRPGKSRFL